MKVLPLLAAAAIAVATGVLYATAFHPVVKQREELSDRLEALQRTNEVLEAEIAELRRKQDDFRTNPDYVELEARRNGLSRQGETVFDFSVSGRRD